VADLDLKVKQLVELDVKSGIYSGEYLSETTKITDEFIQVTLPIEKEQLIPLSVGSKIEVIFTNSSAQYKFESKVLSRKIENKIGTCNLERPDKIYKIQRRGFLRVPIKLTVEYRKLILDDKTESKDNFLGLNYDESKQVEFKKALTQNVSGGGLLLTVNEFITAYSFIELKLDVENLSFETLIGEVVRIDEIPDSKDKIGVGVKFINISQSKQDEIVQWVLQKQLELHRKGLL
jgi:c-di-GMP-binding flagellar brake protein YcgR